MNKKLFWIPILLLCGSLNLTAQRPVYKIGVILPITGEQQAVGVSINEGMEAFFSYKKQNKGFENFLLKAVIYNTESKEENAAQIIQYLAKKNQDYLLLAGGLNDSEVEQLVKLADQSRIPYLFPLRVAFKEKHAQFTFPIFPSLSQGFKYLIRFFNEKKKSYKIIYDEKTRDNAFTLTSSENLLDLNAKDFDAQLAKVSILYLDESRVEEALKKIGNKSIRVFNYNQINLAASAKDLSIWEGALFINWVKGEDQEAVQLFKKTFKDRFNKEPDNFHMLGWMLADLVYSAVQISSANKPGVQISREDFIAELEKTGSRGGYDEGCGYKVVYEPFALSKEKSRIGISGVYFIQMTGGAFSIISDYYPLID